MTNKYYLVIVNGFKIGDRQLDALEIVEAFFDENIWLFSQKIPSVNSLKSGDQLLICGSFKGQNCILGCFTLKTSPKREARQFSGLLGHLSQQFLLSSEITDAVIWENRKPLGELLPKLGVFEERKLASLYLRHGIRQLTKRDFEQIMCAAGDTISVLDEDALPANDSTNFESNMAVETDQGYEAAVEVAGLIQKLVEREIPKRQSAIVSLVEQLQRIPLFEEELAALQSLVESHEETAAGLQMENRTQRDELEELKRELELQKQQQEEEENAYKEKLEQIGLERDQLLLKNESLQLDVEQYKTDLADVSSVKKALQRIISLLQGKRRDSSQSR